MIWKHVTILVILALTTIHTSESNIYKSLKRLLSHRKRCHRCPLSLNGFRRTLPTNIDATTEAVNEKVNFGQGVSDLKNSKYTYNGPDENSTENKNINDVSAHSEEKIYLNEDTKVMDDKNEPHFNSFQELIAPEDSKEKDEIFSSVPDKTQVPNKENAIGADLNNFDLETINKKKTDPIRNRLSDQYIYNTQPNSQIIEPFNESPYFLLNSSKLRNKSYDLSVPIDGYVIKQNKNVPMYPHIVRPSQYDHNSEMLKLLLSDYQKNAKFQQQNMKIDMLKKRELQNPNNTKRRGDLLRNNKKSVMKPVPVANLVLQNKNKVISQQQLPYIHHLVAEHYEPYVLHIPLVKPSPYIVSQAFIDKSKANKIEQFRNVIDEDSNINVEDSTPYRDNKKVLQYLDDDEDITEKSTRNAIEVSNSAKQEKYSFEYFPYIDLDHSDGRDLETNERELSNREDFYSKKSLSSMNEFMPTTKQSLQATDIRRNHRNKPIGFLQDLFSKLTSSLLTLSFQPESNGESGSENLIGELMPSIMKILQATYNSRSRNENPLSILLNIFANLRSLLSSPFANDKSGSTTKAFSNNDSLKRSGGDKKLKSRMVSQKLDKDVPVKFDPFIPVRKSPTSGNFKIPIKRVLPTGNKSNYIIISNFNGKSNLRNVQSVPIQSILRVSAKEISHNSVPIISIEEKNAHLTSSKRPVFFVPSKEKYISRSGIIPQEPSLDIYAGLSGNDNVNNIPSRPDRLNENHVPTLPNELIVSASEEEISSNRPLDIDKENGGFKNGKWSGVVTTSQNNFVSGNGIKAQDLSLDGLSENEKIDSLVNNSFEKNSLENAFFTDYEVDGLRNRKQHDLVLQKNAASRDGFVPEELPVDVSTDDFHEHKNVQEMTSTKSFSPDVGEDEQNFDFLMGYDDEDDDGDFRIIGGNAATGSGTPLSNRGRSGRLI